MVSTKQLFLGPSFCYGAIFAVSISSLCPKKKIYSYVNPETALFTCRSHKPTKITFPQTHAHICKPTFSEFDLYYHQNIFNIVSTSSCYQLHRINCTVSTLSYCNWNHHHDHSTKILSPSNSSCITSATLINPSKASPVKQQDLPGPLTRQPLQPSRQECLILEPRRSFRLHKWPETSHSMWREQPQHPRRHQRRGHSVTLLGEKR